MSKGRMLIEALQAGEIVTTRLHGNSMKPKINSGDLVTISPIALENVHIGDIVYCKVRGQVFAHLVTARGDRGFLISNNHGHDNGWTKNIYGKVTKVEK